MYECESWTIKKGEHWKIDAFELWCWRKLLRVPWTAKGSNQSILKEINPEYSLEGLMLKLKLQYFGYPMWRTDSFEKTPVLGRIEGRRRTGRQRMRWLDASPSQWTWVWVNSGSSWWTGSPGVLKSIGLHRVRQDWVTEWNWTELCNQFPVLSPSFWNKDCDFHSESPSLKWYFASVRPTELRKSTKYPSCCDLDILKHHCNGLAQWPCIC